MVLTVVLGLEGRPETPSRGLDAHRYEAYLHDVDSWLQQAPHVMSMCSARP
jgi:hypothetical protein